jgi:hypothetical protein
LEPFKPDEASHWSAPRRSGRAIHLAVDIAAMLCKFVGRCLRGGSFIPREQTLIEDPETAKYVSNLFLSINDQMDESIRAVENRVSTEEYKVYKRGIGYVMYEVFAKILEPLYKQHPSLKPPDWES